MRRLRLLESHDGDFGFCPANPQLYHTLVKLPQAMRPAIAFPALGRRLMTG
jgi:hypothetical protein